MTQIIDQCNDTLTNISNSFHSHSIDLARIAETESNELIQWLSYLRSTNSGTAIELLDGTRSALIEVIGYIALSLGRASIQAIRTEIDLILSYTYFQDHPKEWGNLASSGNGFMLKSEVVTYHKNIDKGFGQRLTIIEEVSNISLDNIYRTLSAHIHGQSPFTMPKSNLVKDLLFSKELMTSVVLLQKHTIVMLSNFLLALYSNRWPELPQCVVQRVRPLLNSKQVPLFFP